MNFYQKLHYKNELKMLDNAANATRNYFGQVDIQKLGIQLLDEYGRVVNLRESD